MSDLESPSGALRSLVSLLEAHGVTCMATSAYIWVRTVYSDGTGRWEIVQATSRAVRDYLGY